MQQCVLLSSQKTSIPKTVNKNAGPKIVKEKKQLAWLVMTEEQRKNARREQV